MSNALVINTGPLIAFSQIGALELLRQLPLRIVTTEIVREEFLRGRDSEHSVTDDWPEWKEVLPLLQPLPPLATISLDRGEASAIQLALEESIDLVCIDESQGRRCAKALKLQVTGSLGLLGIAKRHGIIAAVRPLVTAMSIQGNWFREDLVAQFLTGLGE